MVDTISSLASIDYRHDEWGVDVTVAGSQKGLMLPPGLGFNAVSAKALAAQRDGAAAALLLGLGGDAGGQPLGLLSLHAGDQPALWPAGGLAMLREEGLDAVFARHARFGAATRGGRSRLGPRDPVPRAGRSIPRSSPACACPPGFDADRFRELVLERFDMSLGQGLGKLKGRMFRIGHLGDFNDLSLMGTLSGVEMGLRAFGVPLAGSGVLAALDVLSGPTGTMAEP